MIDEHEAGSKPRYVTNGGRNGTVIGHGVESRDRAGKVSLADKDSRGAQPRENRIGAMTFSLQRLEGLQRLIVFAVIRQRPARVSIQ